MTIASVSMRDSSLPHKTIFFKPNFRQCGLFSTNYTNRWQKGHGMLPLGKYRPEKRKQATKQKHEIIQNKFWYYDLNTSEVYKKKKKKQNQWIMEVVISRRFVHTPKRHSANREHSVQIWTEAQGIVGIWLILWENSDWWVTWTNYTTVKYGKNHMWKFIWPWKHHPDWCT